MEIQQNNVALHKTICY